MSVTPWYKSFWKVLGMIIALFIVVVGVLFILMTYQEYRKIENGEASTYSTSADNTNTAASNVAQLNYTPDTDDDPYIGNPDAPVVIIGFEDFQCPYCREEYPVLKNVLTQYPDQVLYVYRDFPLQTIHPQAVAAAQAAECADEQGKFWEYHDSLFANQSLLATAGIYSQIAQNVGLDITTFDSCIAAQKYASEVQNDFDEGLLTGVDSTPTFVVNGQVYRGALNETQWSTIIDAELAKVNQ